MSALDYVLGRCSACGGRASRPQVTDTWWHFGPVCPQASLLLYVGAGWGGAISPFGVTKYAARFVEDAL